MAEPIKKTSTRRTRVGGGRISSRGVPRVTRKTKIKTGGAPESGNEVKTNGISLRWKIMAAIAAVTFLTGILIFIVVYSNAVDQLDAEIDAKGERLVSTLASIDDSYWYHAIHRPDQRMTTLNTFLHRVDPTDTWRKSIAQAGAAREQYTKLVRSNGGDSKEEVKASLNAILSGNLWYQEEHNRDFFDNLTAPFGPLDSLEPLFSLKEEGSEDIKRLAVVDVSDGRNSSVTVNGRSEITLPNLDSNEAIAKKDTFENKIPVRIFIRESAPQSPYQLRYYAALSLEKISDAKSTLFWAIFLTVLLAVGAGAGIAIWISTLITNPLKALMNDIQEVSEGNLDHETVPRSTDEIGTLAGTFNKMTSALKVAHEQEILQKKMEHQLSVAREIQENLMPKRVLKLPGYDVAAFYRPSQEVGGDYYDFIEIDDDHSGIIVADVSGKGVPGAIVMSMALAFIREEVDRTQNTSPMGTLTRANRMLAQNIKKGMFVTALYCILNKKTNEMKVASAGHNPLIAWSAAENKVDLINPKGIALGFDKGPVFERTIEEGTLRLNHGDRIVLYTDGAVEAMNTENEEFGDDRFIQLSQQLATRDSNQFLNIIVGKLDEHQGDGPQHDDITIVTMRYL